MHSGIVTTPFGDVGAPPESSPSGNYSEWSASGEGVSEMSASGEGVSEIYGSP